MVVQEEFKAVLVWWKRFKIPEVVDRELVLPASPPWIISI